MCKHCLSQSTCTRYLTIYPLKRIILYCNVIALDSNDDTRHFKNRKSMVKGDSYTCSGQVVDNDCLQDVVRRYMSALVRHKPSTID